jgi:hypothetical protein
MIDRYREHFDAVRSRHHDMLERIHRDSVEDTVSMLENAGFRVDASDIRRDQYVGSVVVMKAVKVQDVAMHEAPPEVPSTPARGTRILAPERSMKDVFVSYSTEDRAIAEQIRKHLERDGIPCWVAERDIKAGEQFAARIVRAIDRSRLLVLVLSDAANRSQYAAKEVARAVERNIPVIPFRSQEVVPADALAFYLSNVHWFDAFEGPMESHLERLTLTVKGLLSTLAGERADAEGAVTVT